MKSFSEHFDNSLWPKIIIKAIENAEKHIDKDFAKYVQFKKIDSVDYKKNLSFLYENKRDWLKRIYFGNFKSDEERCLDMHKIAAIICRSIIGCKPFRFDVQRANEYKRSHNLNKNLDWIIDNYYVNYKVAINCAFAICLYDLFDKLGESNTENQNDELISIFSNQGFDMYNTSILKSEHETFYKSVIINLAINDNNKRDFDYLGFATMCYQLQQNEVLRKQFLLGQ